MEEKAECEQDKWEEEMKQFVKEEVGEQPQTSDSEQQVKAAAGDESDNTVTPSLRHWLLNKKPSLQPENFRETVLHVTEALLEDHGGPVQYLTKVLGTEPGESWDMFARDLDSHFPRRPDLSYHNSLVLPNDNTEVFNLSLYQLGWVKDCSSKPATFKITARRLIDEYLCGSFVTEGDPILLFQSPTTWYEVDDGRGPLFFAHYLKGAARATSILFLAHVLIYHLQADVASLHPELQASLQTVRARRGIAATDAASIALENAKLSARGDIRKAHDTTTWLSKLSLLKQKGLSPPEVIKRWNDSATKESSLLGSKRTALLQLLDLPDSSIQLLLDHSSHFGPEGTAFANETFANKRLSPGYVPRGLEKSWAKRLTVTHEGWRLFVRYVHESHMRKPAGMRKRWDKEMLEEALNLSQCITSCIEEATAQHPITMEAIETQVIAPFLDGNVTMELEVQALVSEAKASFQVAELSCFKELIATCLSKRDEKLTLLGHGPKIAPGQLEEQAFELAMSSLDHDICSFMSWRTKCQDRDSALYFQQLQHTGKRHGQAKDMATALFQSGPSWQLQLSTIDKRDTTNLQSVQSMVQRIMKHNQLQSPEQIHVICIANWSSPSTYAGASQKAQANLLGGIINGPGTHLGIALTPTHFYKKGSLFKAEQACMTLLGNACLNTDSRMALAYSGKRDDRERRALMQPGVVLFPGGSDEQKGKEVWQLFRGASVFQCAVVTDVDMLSSNEMHVIEDMREEALPSSSDNSTHVSQDEEHLQKSV